MNSATNKWFMNLSAAVLFLTGIAKLYSCTGSARILTTQDPLLHLGYRPLLIFAALLEIIIALFLIMNKSDLMRCAVIFWLSSNFLLYHLGSYLIGVHLCACLGHLTDRLPLPPGLGEVLLQFLALYWLLNSFIILWRSWGSEQLKRSVLISKRNLLRYFLESVKELKGDR